MRTPITLLVTLACTLASACGDSGPGDVDSGLPPEKKVSELSASEQETLCRAVAENFAGQLSASEAKHGLCVSLAIPVVATSSDPIADCKTFVAACEDQEAQGGDDGGTDTCMLGIEVTTCVAPVSDVEACYTEQNEAAGQALRDLSCDDIGKEASEPTTGPACAAVKTSCPGIA